MGLRRWRHATAAVVASIFTVASSDCCGIAAAVTASTQDKQSALTTPPHIIYILADDLGWNDGTFQSFGYAHYSRLPVMPR